LNLPFESDSLNLIFSSFSVHEWPQLPKIITEIVRVLKKDCYALLFDVNSFFNRDKWAQLKKKFGYFNARQMKFIQKSANTTWQEIKGLKDFFANRCIIEFKDIEFLSECIIKKIR
jgi:ubiquinone/menaquinone biosynthesis C-methylase UbiE